MLVAVDNCAVGSKLVDEVAARLNKKVKLPRERFVGLFDAHSLCSGLEQRAGLHLRQSAARATSGRISSATPES